MMSKKEINDLVNELKSDGNIQDDEAFDIADGILFDEQEPESLNEALELYESGIHEFDAVLIKDKANRFSKKRFQHEFHQVVKSVEYSLN